MSTNPTEAQRSKCIACGFEAKPETDEWKRVDHPQFGTITQCPECGSTDVHVRT